MLSVGTENILAIPLSMSWSLGANGCGLVAPFFAGTRPASGLTVVTVRRLPSLTCVRVRKVVVGIRRRRAEWAMRQNKLYTNVTDVSAGAHAHRFTMLR